LKHRDNFAFTLEVLMLVYMSVLDSEQRTKMTEVVEKKFVRHVAGCRLIG